MFIFLGATAGFLGIAVGLFTLFSYLAAETSFGVPYLDFCGSGRVFAVPPIWRREERPRELKPQQRRKR